MNAYNHHYQSYLHKYTEDWLLLPKHEFAKALDVISSPNSDSVLGIIHSDWDTHVLGTKTGKLLIQGPDKAEDIDNLINKALRHCQSNGYKLLTARLAYDAFQLIHPLEHAGFKLVDCMNVFSVETKGTKHNLSSLLPEGYHIQHVSNVCSLADTDRKCLAEIAMQAFTHGRIHNDPRFTFHQKNQFNLALCDSLLSNSSNQITILSHETRPIGFCLYGGEPLSNNASIGYLWLIGIDTAYRGLSLGEALLESCILNIRNTYEIFEIATQINNYSALRLYSKLNLRPCASIATFHKWID